MLLSKYYVEAKTMKKFFKTAIAYLALFAVITVVANHLPFILISGDSMYPAYKDGQFVKLTFSTSNIKRDDVVIVKKKIYKHFQNKIVKRVCGLPGDDVYTDKKGIFFIYDGKNIYYYEGTEDTSDKEAFINQCSFKYTINESEYFLMGDNRDHSIDSRTFGTISKTDIISKVKD